MIEKQPIQSSFRELVMRMFDPNPANRLTIDEILDHDWMKQPMPTHDYVKKEMAKRKK